MAKRKTLIVAANIIGVIAIILIIVLHNFNSESVTIDDNDPQDKDPEEDMTESKSSIEFKKINHAKTVGPTVEYTAMDTKVEDDTANEDMVESSEDDAEVMGTEDSYSVPASTNRIALTKESNKSETREEPKNEKSKKTVQNNENDDKQRPSNKQEKESSNPGSGDGNESADKDENGKQEDNKGDEEQNKEDTEESKDKDDGTSDENSSNSGDKTCKGEKADNSGKCPKEEKPKTEQSKQ